MMQGETKPTWLQTAMYILPLLVALGGAAQYVVSRSDPLMASLGLKREIGLTDFEAMLNRNQIQLVQAVADAPLEDGMIGAATRMAISQYQRVNGLEPSGTIDPVLLALVMRDADAKWSDVRGFVSCELPDTVNSFECLHVDAATLERVQRALNVPSSGTFDAATRDAILKYASLSGPSTGAGNGLSEGLFQQILESK